MTDSCADLKAEIAALRAEIAKIPRVDENRIVQTTKAALEPGIATAVTGGIAVVAAKLDPKIKEALNKAFNAESAATNAERNSLAAKRTEEELLRKQIQFQQEAQAARQAAESAAQSAKKSASSSAESAKNSSQSSNFAGESNRSAGQAKSEAEIAKDAATRSEVQSRLSRDAARIAAQESELAKGIANQADFKAGKAVSQSSEAVSKSAKAIADSANAVNEAQGLKGIVHGVKDRVGQLGNAIVKIENAVGEAIFKAGEAIGISREALSSAGRLAGRVAQLFSIVAEIFNILQILAFAETLGARIDAVENGLQQISDSVSNILGRILPGIRGIAVRALGDAGIALGVANALNGQVGTALREASSASANARDALGAARNASLAVVAVEATANTAQSIANKASGKADTAQSTATKASTKADTAQKSAVVAQLEAAIAQKQSGSAFQKALEAIGLATTAITIASAVRALRGIPGVPGRAGRDGLPGRNGLNGAPGITQIVQLPGTPGRDGRNGLNGLPGKQGRDGLNGLPGKDGKDGKDVNPGDLAGLRALIVSQHTQTRANSTAQHGTTRTTILTPILAALAPILALLKQIYDLIAAASNAAILALLNVVNTKLGAQVTGGLSQFIKTIAENTYLDKALNMLTFAVTLHNGLMLSSQLGQALITIINQVVGLVLPKGIDGNPIDLGASLGKGIEELITLAIGSENYTELKEDWAKANRIYQSTSNVFNHVTQLGGLITTGLEVVGGNVGKIGNALKKGGVLLEDAYNYMNPQPNLQGKFFSFMNTANEKLSSIAAVVAIPIAFKEVLGGINSSTADLKREISQTDPKDEHGNPIRDKEGNIVHYKPGIEVPTPIVEEAKGQQSKADSTNFIELVLEDIFDAGD